MNYEYAKAQPITLREAGKNERWLHDLIMKDPTILGLGDVLLIQHERSQPTGGRIDLILADNDTEQAIRYEVEIMLGKVDESHIIRTIEYWDVERRRYPNYQHRAVIVAEEITNRFFNVISLLNKAVPIIAIQLNAVILSDKLTLNFVRVLDLVEEEEDDAGAQVDRKYWETDGRLKSLAVMDSVIALIPKKTGDVRIKYNSGYVAVGTSGDNFAWFFLRKGEHVLFEVMTGEASRDSFISQLEGKGIESRPHRHPSTLKISLTMKELESNQELVRSVMAKAEEFARTP